ncbi:nitronate monooxygenase [Sedimentibacter hydroxybenzoicus DSM 7310]|uniref:Probable nitronate monooxygenase n=1 Tax=Sedimentibacter hydroxybenzoicus DSM 7310 TaxID=1123245 RepID=A0A974BIG8_SEDHY|nr:nitronate monooxygenase [Sedimentibacter hydroxybenzoicus]NYB73788.1 nitronate monooxygenase [Sedimentibacter hydroxybenzoicus DSM 7310]
MGNRVTELFKIERPILEGAMAYACDAKLAKAFCDAGGLGLLGMNCTIVDKNEYDPIKNAENMRGEIRKLRSMTDKPFAVNYIPPMKGTDPKSNYSGPFKQLIIEEKVPVVVIVGDFNDGMIAPEIEDFKNAGVTVVYREACCTVQTCVDAVKAGADAIIVTGCEAGGHNSKYNMSLACILPQVTDVLTDVPIIAAGGIVGEKSARAAVAMGADGVYIGTAIMVAEEARMHPNFKQAIIDAQGEDIVTWRASTARMNTTNNYLGRVCSALAAGGASPYEIAQHYTGDHFIKAMMQGDVEHGCVTLSGACGAIKEIRSTKAILDDIAKGMGY